jgi:hypothetical protein
VSSRTDEITQFLSVTTSLASAGRNGSSDSEISFHQGRILSWNGSGGTNKIEVAGTSLDNLPALTSAGLIALREGDVVGVLRYKTTYFVLGRVVALNTQLVEPQWPVVVYPQFQRSEALGTSGYSSIAAGSLFSWEGRIRASHPKIEIDGVWGQSSGSNTTTYAIKLGGNVVGQWTVGGALEVARHGPYDISAFIGQDWLKIEVSITASSGTGQVAFQPLGLYFRQT